MPAITLRPFSGTVVRQTGLRNPALPPGRPAPIDARFHRAGDPWPLYAALDEPTLWAEWRRANPAALPDERRRLWRLEVTDLLVLDLREPGIIEALGLEMADLVGPRELAQPLAVRARALGAHGLIVPSAGRSGGWNIVVFPEGFDRIRVRGRSDRRPLR